ncbi:MAG: DUF5686 family protein [Catalinimonas sp.]
MNTRRFILGSLLGLFVGPLWAQVTVTGKVIDAETGEGLPFANVYFQDTQDGVTTDFDGYYTLTSHQPTDSLVAGSMGYGTRVKAVGAGSKLTINFQLHSVSVQLDEFVVMVGENPAFPIMREVIRRKADHDPRRLTAYQYESYNKIEIDVDEISEKFRRRPVVRRIAQVFDSLDRIAGEDGKPILPVFISESLSEYYFRRDPRKQREYIRKTKLTGIGMDDGSLISQMIGSSFQQYNFYANWLNILDKEFVSPIADGWNLYYHYLLEDSLYVGDDWCYRLDVRPRQAGDLAFSGSIWITADEHALRQVDLTVGAQANLNFIEKIRIQQELARAGDAWLPAKNRIVIDVGELTENSAGMLAKFYSSNRAFVVNDPKEVRFYDQRVELAADAQRAEPDFWQTHRHDSLTPTEVAVYEMIDTIRNLPVVKTYVEIVDVIVNGYSKWGKLDVGPYLYTYAFNNVEGHRFRLGFRTNEDLSRKFILHGYGAYGTRDRRWKYSGQVDYIAARRNWLVLGARHVEDINQVALLGNEGQGNPLFNAFTRFGDLQQNRPFVERTTDVYAHGDVVKGLNARLDLRRRHFDPLYDLRYFTQKRHDDLTPMDDDFTIAEATVGLRWAPGETYLQNDNERVRIRSNKWPVLALRYTHGFEGLVGGDFDYNHWDLRVEQQVPMGLFGRGFYQLDAGVIPATLPYPLLRPHLGNESPFYNQQSYNLMNYFEFVSDRWAGVRYQHAFEGFVLNRVPLMKRLKWRLVAGGSVLFGELSEANRTFSFEQLPDGDRLQVRALGRDPYAEVSYGVENILRVLRVDFIHRLTYLDDGAAPFGVRVQAQFKL